MESFLKDKTKDGLSVVTELIGQEIVERKRKSLPGNLKIILCLVKAVSHSALINANDVLVIHRFIIPLLKEYPILGLSSSEWW